MRNAALLAAGLVLLASSAEGQFRVPRLSTVAELGTCNESGLLTGPRIVGVTDGLDSSDCSVGGGEAKVPCWCDGTEWVTMFSAGSSGDITAVGNCSTEACFQSVGQRFAFLGPTGASGVASFRAITEADISDLQDYALSSELPASLGDLGVTDLAELNTAIGASLADGPHTVDTDNQTAPEVPYTPTMGADWTDPDPAEASGALDALAGRLTTEEGKVDDDVPESGDFGALALSGDVTSSGLVTTLAADTVGLAELAACPGPGEIVEYGASGVPSCIATPGGTPAGSDTQAQYNNSGAFGGMAGVLWDDSALELTVRGQTDAVTERVAIFSGPDRVTPAVGDESSFSLFSDTSGGFSEMGRVTWKTNAAASGPSQSSRIDFLVNFSGTMTTALRVSAYGTAPAVGLPAGTSSTPGWNFGAESSGNGSDEGCYWVSNGIVSCVGQGSEAFRWQAGILRLPTAGALTWSTDAGFKRGAAARVDVTDGSTGAGSISALMAQLVPQASAPTCPAANSGLYFDSSGSGALCACPPGGSWVMFLDFGSGNCT